MLFTEKPEFWEKRLSHILKGAQQNSARVFKIVHYKVDKCLKGFNQDQRKSYSEQERVPVFFFQIKLWSWKTFSFKTANKCKQHFFIQPSAIIQSDKCSSNQPWKQTKLFPPSESKNRIIYIKLMMNRWLWFYICSTMREEPLFEVEMHWMGNQPG